MFIQASVLIALVAATAHGHTMGWAKGMYCLGGNNTAVDDNNTNAAVNPLYDLPQEKWWFQADRGCDKAPPKDGDFLTLPAGGTVTVEMAHNRAQTTLSYGGQYANDWPDGKDHNDTWAGPGSPPDCIQDDGAMHTNNQSMAAGTALAISYESDITAVTMENLVVFTVLEHTPWKRIATYQVPKGLPACPTGGCHCAFLWIPNGCGQPNMYMAGYKCQVTGATSTAPLALPAKPPVYCGDDATKCVKGAKQMMAWNQATGNNVSPPNGISPAYGTIMGYSLGAQEDIFSSSSVSTSTVASSSAPPASSSTTSTASTQPPSSATLPAVSSSAVSSSSTTSSTTSKASTATSVALQKPSSSSTSQATVTVTTTMPAVTVTVTKTVRSGRATARV